MRTLAILALIGCGGTHAASDASSFSDASSDVSADASTDASNDGSADTEDARADSGARRLDGPGDEEPPETSIEPGSGADDAYRYCWHLARILCLGMHECCEVDGLIGDDAEECASLGQENCEAYVDHPEAFGPQDRASLESNLNSFASGAADCSNDLRLKFAFVVGDVDVGGDCTSESFNPNLLCREGLWCIDDACTPRPELGEACGGTDPGPCRDFDNAYCSEERICTARVLRDDGAACDGAFECASQRCDEGTCTPTNPWCFGLDTRD